MGRSKATLFLMEQLIVITIFAVCAAVCVSIIAEAYFMANDARDLNQAVIAAKNGAELYKASASLEEVAATLGGQAHSPGEAVVYYNRDWRVCEAQEAEYALRFVRAESAGAPFLCELSVERVSSGGEIFALTAAKGGGGGG